MSVDVLRAFLRRTPLSTKFMRMLIWVIVGLLVFHIFVILAPLVEKITQGSLFTDGLDHLHFVSKSLGFATVTLILVAVLAHCQRRLFEFGSTFRNELYASIAKQILTWLRESQASVEAAQIDTGGIGISIEHKLEHIKITGGPQQIMADNKLPNSLSTRVKEYCRNVHFELTSYPSELFYGIHFEFSSSNLNEKLCDEVRQLLALDRKYTALVTDNHLPKHPAWIFLCTRIETGTEFSTEMPKIATHCRHFVELVCHTYNLLYGKHMIKTFLDFTEK